MKKVVLNKKALIFDIVSFIFMGILFSGNLKKDLTNAKNNIYINNSNNMHPHTSKHSDDRSYWE